MPNSERVALVLTEAVVGGHYWVHGVCASMPDNLYEETKLAAVAVLELTAAAIDWDRLLQEAEWRHHAVHCGTQPAQDKRRTTWVPATTDVCGECLREALLAHGYEGHTQDWKNQPDVTRRAAGIDWAGVFARVLPHRRTPAQRALPTETTGRPR